MPPEPSQNEQGAQSRFGDRISSVPPDAFNPRMIRAGSAPELLVHWSSVGKRESVSFWEKVGGFRH